MVVVPQLVTAAIALWISRRANEWGRKPFLLAGFAAVLLRTVLFSLAPGPWFLVAVQVLDGLTSAVVGIMMPLLVADLTRSTGRYNFTLGNFTLGAIGMVGMAGASVSTTATGFLVQHYSFACGFAPLGAAASAGILLLWWLVPETLHIALQDD
jgi:MFS family permease